MILCDLTEQEIKKVASDYFKVSPERLHIELKKFDFDSLEGGQGTYYRYCNINIRSYGSPLQYVTQNNNELYVIKGFPFVASSSFLVRSVEGVGGSPVLVGFPISDEKQISDFFFRSLSLRIGPYSYDTYKFYNYVLAYKITLIS